MMAIDDLLATISMLQRSDLERWIREELVAPQQDLGSLLFSDMECARVRLICTLTQQNVAAAKRAEHIFGAAPVVSLAFGQFE